jgi:hypothetical protein
VEFRQLFQLPSELRNTVDDRLSLRPVRNSHAGGALAASVRAGPLDETGWSLLGGNAAVAAKLRQLAPRLEARLHERGHAVTSIRIKVSPG